MKNTSTVFTTVLILSFSTLTHAAEAWDFEVLPKASQNEIRAGENEPSDSLFTTSLIEEAKKQRGLDWGAVLNAVVGSKRTTPTGAQSDPVSEECSGRAVERQMLQARGDFRRVVGVLKNYAEKCDEMLSRNNHRSLVAVRDLDNYNFSLQNTPGVQRFRLRTPLSDEIQGIIARKEGRRPWVVMKCGIFCEAATSSTVKVALIHLFEEAPFNLLVLDNHTAYSNIVANRRLNFGGFYEGQEMLISAYWLKYVSPFASEVLDIHAMGISLGGNAALYAGLYNDHNTFHGEKLFKSVLAYCPAVNMEPTVKEVFRQTPKGILFSMKAWNTLRDASYQVEEIAAALPSRKPSLGGFPALIADLNTRFLGGKDPLSFMPPFEFDHPMNDAGTYWGLNNFVHHVNGLQTPTLIWASKNDWVVDNGWNAGNVGGHVGDDPRTNLRVINMKYGNHCAKSSTYGWQAVTAVMRGYFLSFTDPTKFSTQEIEAPVSLNFPRWYSSEQFVGAEWVAGANSDQLTLKVKTWEPVVDDYNGCGAGYGAVPKRNYSPYTADRQCYTERLVKVPLRSLASVGGFETANLAVPTSSAQAESLTRYLNSHVELWSSSGSPLGRHVVPNRLRVRTYGAQ